MSLITPDSLIQYVKPWGVGYRPSIKYAACHYCPKCEGLQKVGSNRAWFTAVVGFSRNQPRKSDQGIGILIIECPHCDTRFWSHLDPAGIWNCMLFCPRWPDRLKHPDLRKK